jgi:hypothetical protein
MMPELTGDGRWVMYGVRIWGWGRVGLEGGWGIGGGMMMEIDDDDEVGDQVI